MRLQPRIVAIPSCCSGLQAPPTLFGDIRVCQDDCGVLKDGTYYSLRSGSIIVNNQQGELTMNAGDFSFAGFNQPPIILPRDPGIGFTPPPNTIPDLRGDKGDSLVKEIAQPIADSSDVKCEIR